MQFGIELNTYCRESKMRGYWHKLFWLRSKYLRFFKFEILISTKERLFDFKWISFNEKQLNKSERNAILLLERLIDFKSFSCWFIPRIDILPFLNF